MLVPKGQFRGAQWHHSVSLAFSTEEKSPSLSSFWKEWPPGGKDLGCQKQDCQTESHLFTPQSPKCLCCFFFIISCEQHANLSLLLQNPHCYYPLQEGSRAQIREGTCSGHPASWDMLESSLLAPGPGSWAPCLPQAASAAGPSSFRQGKASALKPSPPGTSRWINYLRLCLALYQPPLRQLQSG